MGLIDFFKKGKEKPIERPPSGNVEKGPAPATNSDRDYTIKSGDSLSKIAKQFYGNAADWRRIYEANKDTIKNPDLIFPGQKIKIP